jgi:hypothetical protein
MSAVMPIAGTDEWPVLTATAHCRHAACPAEKE